MIQVVTMDVFLKSNDAKYRLLRTIAQGAVGVVIANLDLLLGYTVIPAELRPFVTALCMAVLSPIMAMLGESEQIHEQG